MNESGIVVGVVVSLATVLAAIVKYVLELLNAQEWR